jgi:TP901 family phage tail tape measure protein
VLAQSISGFSQRMTEGLSNATSNVSLALRGLGLSARDTQGNVKNFADFLPEVADKFASLKDGVQKAQVASALFGEEAGPRLIPLLNQGSAGVEKLTAEVKKYGLANADSVRQAQEFQRISLQLSSAVEELARELIKLAAQPLVLEFLKATAALLRHHDQKHHCGRHG